MVMRVAVCDDESDQVFGIVNLIQHWAAEKQTDINVDTFTSAEEFMFRWSGGHVYDLIVLDIKLKKMSGIDLAKSIRETDQVLQIIFITGLAEHVFDGYDVSALNYLLKPFVPELFFKALEKAYALYKRKETENLLISQEGSIIRIPYNEILYMEIHGHYFDIYTIAMGNFRTKKQMDDMLLVLDKRLFIRCHRSYIINVTHVAKLDHQDIILKNGVTIPLSHTNIQPVTQLFQEYHYKHGTSLLY